MKAKLEHLPHTGTQVLNCFEVSLNRFRPFWHFHPETELTFISKGTGTRFVGNSIQSFEAGDLVLLGADLPHQWVSNQDHEGTEVHTVVIHFSAATLLSWDECAEVENLFSLASRGIFFPDVPEDISAMLLEISRSKKMLQLSYLLQILHHLNGAKKEILHNGNTHSFKSKGAGKTALVTGFIIENLKGPIPLEKIAEVAGMTTASFSRWFKRQTGNTFTSFLNHSRISEASRLIITTEMPISEIAFRCGFENVSHFNRTFKKIKGCSPRQLRSANLSL